MKKIIVISGFLAAMIVVALVFTFCTKEIKQSFLTEEEKIKMEKATPDCFAFGRQVVVLTLSTGVMIEVCVSCSSFQNGHVETCFNLTENKDEDCQHYPYGTCCPYPLRISYTGPQPATSALLQNPNNWQWNGSSSNLPSNVSVDDLLQIVADPNLGCF